MWAPWVHDIGHKYHRTDGATPRGVLGALLLVFGILISIAGMGVLAAGILAASANQFRDSEGYFAAPTETFTTQSYALTSPRRRDPTASGYAKSAVRSRHRTFERHSADSDIFIGIAPKADIDHYLDDVKRTEISSIRYFPFEVEYRDIPGSHAPAAPRGRSPSGRSPLPDPARKRSSGAVAPGEWGVVVMNADGTPGVTADLQAAVRSDLISPIATSLIIIGAVLLLIGLPMLIVGAVILGRRIPPARATTPPPVPTVPPRPRARYRWPHQAKPCHRLPGPFRHALTGCATSTSPAGCGW